MNVGIGVAIVVAVLVAVLVWRHHLSPCARCRRLIRLQDLYDNTLSYGVWDLEELRKRRSFIEAGRNKWCGRCRE